MYLEHPEAKLVRTICCFCLFVCIFRSILFIYLFIYLFIFVVVVLFSYKTIYLEFRMPDHITLDRFLTGIVL